MSTPADGYWPITFPEPTSYTCRVCGSVTTDPALHDRWHDALAENGEQK